MPLNVQHSSLSISRTLSSQSSFHAAYHANGFFPHTHAMTTHAMFAPYKSRVVSRGGLLLPLTYLPGTSVEKKITRPAQMGCSPSRTTTSPTVYFQESRVAVQHPFPNMYYYNVVPRHLSSNSIDLNFLLFWRRCQIDVASLRWCQPAGAQTHL